MVDQIRNIIAAGERTSRDVFFQAAADVLEQVTLVHRHGISYDIPNSDRQTVWEQNFNYPRILTADQIELVSTDAEDSAAGLGAQRVLMSGCDGNGDPQWDIVLLDGLTPVLTPKSFFWVDFAHVIAAGEPYGGAKGTITMTHQGSVVAGDTPIVGTIKPEENRTAQAVAVIPNHYSGYLLNHEVAVPENGAVIYGFRISSWLNSSGNGVQQVAFMHGAEGSGGPYQIAARASERIHFPSLIEMVGQAVLGSGLRMSASFSLMAVHDRYDFSIPGDFFDLAVGEIEPELRLRPGLATMPGSFYWEPEA